MLTAKIAMYENLASLFTHKGQWLDSYPQMKTTLQEAVEFTVSNTVEHKNLRIIAQQKKEDCMHHPMLALFSTKKELSQLERLPRV